MSNIENTESQAVVKTEIGAMAMITLKPEAYATEVYQPFKDRLNAAIESVKGIDYDITTTKGLEVATKARRLMADIRIDADKERKARKAPITQIGKLLQSHYDAVEEAVLPLETLFDDDIKAEERRKEEVKKEKERAEAARISAISELIAAINKLPMKVVRMSAAQIAEVVAELEAVQIDESFEEFLPQAQKAWDEAKSTLDTLHKEAADDEAAKEAARIAAEEETRKQAKERAELAAKQAELDRIANEQAAERKRLADEQAAIEAAAAEQRRKAEENARAEAEAQQARLKAEAEAHAAEMKRQSDELAAQRAKFEEQQAQAKAAAEAEQKAKEAAAQLEADHVEALRVNAFYSLPVEDGCHYSASVFDQDGNPVYVAPVKEPAYQAPEILNVAIGHSLMDDWSSIDAHTSASDAPADPQEPSDKEIVLLYMTTYDVEENVAIERLSRFALTIEA